MGGAAQIKFGRFALGFRKRGMGVNAESHILGQCPHFNGQDTFGDQSFRIATTYPNAQNPTRLRISNDFGHAFRWFA